MAIFVGVPEPQLTRTSATWWRRRLCAPLRIRGWASLNPIPGSREQMLKALLAEDKRKMIDPRPGKKPLFFARIYVAAPPLLPWIAAERECLRAAEGAT